MNIFKKFYCRIFQSIFRILLPILPYRQPKLLTSNEAVINVLIKNKKKSAIIVTDNQIYSLGLTQNLEKCLKQSNIKYVVFKDVIPNPTTKNVYDAENTYKNNNCDSIIAFGGGSALDTAKALGARIAVPQKSLKRMKGILKVRKKIPLLIAVPTTAGTGSETTLAAVITDSETRHKYAINDFSLIPQYALLNAKLTIGLPKNITATTGMDALTHSIEAYIGRSTTKQTRSCALESVRLIFENLLIAYSEPSNLIARENMLKASYLAGVAFTQSYVGYIHSITHSLGGKYNIPHGLANAIVMPYILKEYDKKIYKKLWKIGLYSNLFDNNTRYEDGAKILINKIEELNKKLNIPSSIQEIKIEDIPELAKNAEREANPLYPVPVLLSNKDLEKIYLKVKQGND